MKITSFCVILVIASTSHYVEASPGPDEVIKTFELYTKVVSPDLFNWTSSVVEQFR